MLPLPAFNDNYIWMLHNGHDALVVDPGDAQPVLDALEHHALTLQSILVTHHHADHTGGIHTLRQATGAHVFGPARETIPEPLTRLKESDVVRALGMDFRVLDVPGHTAGHIAYFVQPAGESPILFPGDTLFSGGCGRLFEGTAEQMLQSLSKLSVLPADTRVCCTHEYTLSNLRFAVVVEPGNALLREHQVSCQQLREQGLPTLPSSIALELQINPFLRSHLPSIADSVRAHNLQGTHAADVFATLREWKNTFQ